MKAMLFPVVLAVALTGCGVKGQPMIAAHAPAGFSAQNKVSAPNPNDVTLTAMSVLTQRIMESDGPIPLGGNGTTVTLKPVDKVDVTVTVQSHHREYLITVSELRFQPGQTSASKPEKAQDLRMAYYSGAESFNQFPIQGITKTLFLSALAEAPGLTPAEQKRLVGYLNLKRSAADAGN